MLSCRRLLFCALGLSLAVLTGCEMFSSDAGSGDSIMYRRSTPPPEEKRENTGGFAVLVGAPGQPTAERVVADIGTFARGRGFVRQPATPDRYVSGDITLDVVYRTTDLRVAANLHSFSSRLNRKFVDQFYQGFRQQYAGPYGPDASMDEIDEADDSGSPARGSGGGGRSGNRGRGGR